MLMERKAATGRISPAGLRYAKLNDAPEAPAPCVELRALPPLGCAELLAHGPAQGLPGATPRCSRGSCRRVPVRGSQPRFFLRSRATRYASREFVLRGSRDEQV